MFGEAEVDVGEVDEDGEGGAVALEGGDERAVLARKTQRHVAEDFGDAHVGDVFGADDAGLAGGCHLGAAEAGEGGGGDAAAQFGDDLGAVVVAGGFAGGEEDARVGGGGDEASLAGGQRSQADLRGLGLLKVVGLDCLDNVRAQGFPSVGFGDYVLAEGFGDESAVGLLRNLKDEFAHRDTIR